MTTRKKTSAYHRELDRIPTAIEFVRQIPISDLSAQLGFLANKPLLAVGSGGSFSVATLASILHESSTGQVGKAITPFQSVAVKSPIDAGVLLISAGGRNPDAMTAFRALTKRANGPVVVVTASPSSKLAEMATENDSTRIFSFALPFRRDGFLATNTLIATSLLLSRAYQEILGVDQVGFDQIRCLPGWHDQPERRQAITNVVSKNTLIVLAGGWAWPAAVDLESKFSESGLKHIQLVDYRNFAHGRHFWLAKRGEDTGVLALASPDTISIANQTLSTLPANVDRFVLDTNLSDSPGAIDLMCQGLFIVGLAEEESGHGLARPGVPEFGRRLYRSGFEEPESQSIFDTWVHRKTMAMGVVSGQIIEKVGKSLEEFLTRLTHVQFEAIVTDYDGTICDSRQMGSPPSERIKQELIRLLDAGLILGIATGRGNSVVRALRESLPREYWHQIVVGTYGGALISSLDEEVMEELTNDLILIKVENHLRSKLVITGLRFDVSPQLLSIRPERSADMAALRNVVVENLNGLISERRIVESAHSVDVLGERSSKLNVVEAVASRLMSPNADAVLRMGDQGAWGGNDFELLASGLSLSVDRVSADLSTCWNISRPGRPSSMAAIDYLGAIKKRGKRFQYKHSPSGFA